MKVSELEDKIWELEGVRVVVRATANTKVGDYKYKKAAQETWRVTEWLKNRVTPAAGKHEVVVLQGDGEEPHGRVILRTLRSSYA